MAIKNIVHLRTYKDARHLRIVKQMQVSGVLPGPGIANTTGSVSRVGRRALDSPSQLPAGGGERRTFFIIYNSEEECEFLFSTEAERLSRNFLHHKSEERFFWFLVFIYIFIYFV